MKLRYPQPPPAYLDPTNHRYLMPLFEDLGNDPSFPEFDLDRLADTGSLGDWSTMRATETGSLVSLVSLVSLNSIILPSY